MPDRAYTVSPVYSEEDGSYQASVVTHGHTGGQSDASDYVENERGELQYQYQPPDNYQDPEATHWDQDEYLGTLIEAMPHLPKVIEHITTADDIPVEFAEEWNQMMDGEIQNMDRFHELLEMFLESYEASGGETQEQSPDEQWFDENFEQLQEELDIAQNTTYTYEQAEVMASLAAEYQHGSAEQAILRAGVDLAFNKQSFEQAFDQITSQYGQAAAAKAYYQIKKRLETP